MMKKTMNVITQINLEEELFSAGVMDIVESWYTDFYEDSIVIHCKKYKSRKKKICQIDVSYIEMKKFFSDVYKFIRTADDCYNAEDDCIHKLTIIYASNHKEILEGCACRGEEQILAMIHEFMKKHGVKDDWIF